LDGALAVVINETQRTSSFIGGLTTRGDGSSTVSMSEDLQAGDVIHGYLFLRVKMQPKFQIPDILPIP